MSKFCESTYEEAFVDLLEQNGWEYTCGDDLHRKLDETIIEDDLRDYLSRKYAGTTYSDYIHYYAWKKVENEDPAANKDVPQLETLIKGAYRPDRLLQILRDEGWRGLTRSSKTSLRSWRRSSRPARPFRTWRTML